MGGRRKFLEIGTDFSCKKWLSLNPAGLFGVGISWIVHLYALATIPYHLIQNQLISTIIFFAFYLPCSILAMASLYKAWTTDPGAVPLGARPLTVIRRAQPQSEANNNQNGTAAVQRATRRCHKCNDNFKPPRAHHDSVTGRCVVKFDHFCPWVGNAVGVLNHKYFCLFLLYTAISCLLSLLLFLLRAVHCGYTVGHSDDEETNFDPTRRLGKKYLFEKDCEDLYGNRWVLALFICSFVFLIFTCSMGCEQVEAIHTGQSKIARMKMRVGNAGTEFARVTEGFNEMFGGSTTDVDWHWYSPWSPVEYPRGMKKVVLGYDWDENMGDGIWQEDNRDIEMMENEKRESTPATPKGDGILRSSSQTSTSSDGLRMRQDSSSIV